MPVQLESLKIFCDVARLHSFSQGAVENGISQSFASQVVNQIETRLGVRLIDRSKRPLLLTPQGQLFFEGVKDLVHRYLEVEDRVRAFADERTVAGRIRLAAIYSVGLNSMGGYVRSFKESHPKAEVRLSYLHPDQVHESVAEERADLGILAFPGKWTDVVVIPWKSEPMVLAVHPSHRLAGQPSVDVRALDGEKLVHFAPELAIRRVIDKFLRKNNVGVDVALEFDNIENIKRAVEYSDGVAILPEPALRREVQAGLLMALPLKDADLTRDLSIIHRKCELPLLSQRFLDLLLAPEVEAPQSPATALVLSGGD